MPVPQARPRNNTIEQLLDARERMLDNRGVADRSLT
jgi:hypothetical protein